MLFLQKPPESKKAQSDMARYGPFVERKIEVKPMFTLLLWYENRVNLRAKAT